MNISVCCARATATSSLGFPALVIASWKSRAPLNGQVVSPVPRNVMVGGIPDAVEHAHASLGLIEPVLHTDAEHSEIRRVLGPGVHHAGASTGPAAAMDRDERGMTLARVETGRLEQVEVELPAPDHLVNQLTGGLEGRGDPPVVVQLAYRRRRREQTGAGQGECDGDAEPWGLHAAPRGKAGAGARATGFPCFPQGSPDGPVCFEAVTRISWVVSSSLRHNREQHRFEVVAGEGTAVLDYVLNGRTAVFTHTEVPPALRGRGIAEDLVRTGLAWAAEEKLTVQPACSYVAKFIERHPEFAPLLNAANLK